MNIFNIIESNFFRIPRSRYGIGCRFRDSDAEIRIIDNYSNIPTDALVSILNGRLRSSVRYSALRTERNVNLDILITGRSSEEDEIRALCTVKHIQGTSVEFLQYIADVLIFVFNEGHIPSYVSENRLNVEINSIRSSEIDTASAMDSCKKKKNTTIDVDCLIDANEFVDKISKCCNNNSAKIIVRHGDDELKIVDTCIEKGFLYIDVVNPKKLKGILDSMRSELINSARPRRSSGAQIAIENMVKVDDEILEDAFTCNMLIDRIKNCDTICSGAVKIKIIVREDNKEMMITNTVFNDNILVIDIDDVKEKELDDNEFLNIRMGDGLWAQTNQAFNIYNINDGTSITDVSSDTSNVF